VRFSWKETGDRRIRGKGIARDMSVAGIFVLTPMNPPVGTDVEIEVAPSKPLGMSKSLIKARMKVLRIEDGFEGDQRRGFAANGKVFVGGSGRNRRSVPDRSSHVGADGSGFRQGPQMNGSEGPAVNVIRWCLDSDPLNPIDKPQPLEHQDATAAGPAATRLRRIRN